MSATRSAVNVAGYDPAATVSTSGDALAPPTMRRARVSTAVCPRCMGTKVLRFQWFGEQSCHECDGTGESDE